MRQTDTKEAATMRTYEIEYVPFIAHPDFISVFREANYSNKTIVDGLDKKNAVGNAHASIHIAKIIHVQEVK
jgi:hypothetical protein